MSSAGGAGAGLILTHVPLLHVIPRLSLLLSQYSYPIK